MMRFGPWSTTLELGMLFAEVAAAALMARPGQRDANRSVPALLEVNALKLPAYPIGIVGFYDAYRWLSFAPLNHELALGPVLRLHVQLCNSGPRPSAHWGWHLLPLGLALGLSACFVWPLA